MCVFVRTYVCVCLRMCVRACVCAVQECECVRSCVCACSLVSHVCACTCGSGRREGSKNTSMFLCSLVCAECLPRVYNNY